MRKPWVLREHCYPRGVVLIVAIAATRLGFWDHVTIRHVLYYTEIAVLIWWVATHFWFRHKTKYEVLE